MRVTDNLRMELFKNSVLSIREKLQKTSDQISSQKAILSPSDDPVGTSQYIQLSAQKSRNDQYVKNMERLTMLSGTTEASINSISDVLTQAKQLAVTMSSDTVSADTRASAVAQVEGLIEQLVTVGNTNVSGTYIFGGKKTDTAPFTLNTTDPTDPATYYTVTYNGTADVPKVNVAAGQSVNLGMTGEAVFGTGSAATSIFTTLKSFRDALASNNTTTIKQSLDAINDAVDLTADNLSAVGAYSNRIENLNQLTEDNSTRLKVNISEIMDVDVVAAITDYTLLTTAYEAALSAMSKVQSMNILNYLK